MIDQGKVYLVAKVPSFKGIVLHTTIYYRAEPSMESAMECERIINSDFSLNTHKAMSGKELHEFYEMHKHSKTVRFKETI